MPWWHLLAQFMDAQQAQDETATAKASPPGKQPKIDPRVAKNAGGAGFLDTLMLLMDAHPAAFKEERLRGAYGTWDKKDKVLSMVPMGDDPTGDLQTLFRSILAHEMGHAAAPPHFSEYANKESFANSASVKAQHMLPGMDPAFPDSNMIAYPDTLHPKEWGEGYQYQWLDSLLRANAPKLAGYQHGQSVVNQLLGVR